jgi:hypothetical protein
MIRNQLQDAIQLTVPIGAKGSVLYFVGRFEMTFFRCPICKYVIDERSGFR